MTGNPYQSPLFIAILILSAEKTRPLVEARRCFSSAATSRRAYNYDTHGQLAFATAQRRRSLLIQSRTNHLSPLGSEPSADQTSKIDGHFVDDTVVVSEESSSECFDSGNSREVHHREVLVVDDVKISNEWIEETLEDNVIHTNGDDDDYYNQMFERISGVSDRESSDLTDELVNGEDPVQLLDFIEQNVGIQPKQGKKRRGRAKTPRDVPRKTSKWLSDSEEIMFESIGEVKATSPAATMDAHADEVQVFASSSSLIQIMEEQPPPRVNENKGAPFNVVCTHITADFDTLASAIGLAKLWSLGKYDEEVDELELDCAVNGPLPTYVVLPRGAHPDVQRFLSLHKHLFPIRSLKSLPGFSDQDIKKGAVNKNPNEGLQRVGLVDAQRRDRLGPAEVLLGRAKQGVTIVDHHVDAESDIEETRHYVVENVGSVSTMIAERLKTNGVDLTEAEATVLALGIHSDTGSLVYDSTTPKDARMLGWVLEMGASQTAIAEHATPTLSDEQQGVLTQALISMNSTTVHGVTISTVLLRSDGFIPGLATVTKDALDLSSSDIFLLAVCYEATRSGSGGKRKSKRKGGGSYEKLPSRRKTVKPISEPESENVEETNVPHLLGGGLSSGSEMINSESWKGGEASFQRQRLAATFAFYDTDRSGYLEKDEISQALAAAGYLISQDQFDDLISAIDDDGDGRIDFEEFANFYIDMEGRKKWDEMKKEIDNNLPSSPCTLTLIGRIKAGVDVRNVNLNTLFQQFNGGGHPKAASATTKLDNENEAKTVLQRLVDELVEASLAKQLTLKDFMQSPVLSAKPSMTEKQIEDLFIRYDVRALPVVDDDNQVIGLVTYKEVSQAKLRLLNKQEKRLRQVEKAAQEGRPLPKARPLETSLKGWMKQHVTVAEANMTMREVEQMLLETDVGCIPVVEDGTRSLIGMITRTDLLRQHRYYNSLHYHNKGFSDSIAARKPIIELRKRLKKFDIENG